jgi:hypothetical protein
MTTEYVSNIEWLVDDVSHVEEYRLIVTFRNGTQKLVNLEAEIKQGGIYEPLQDITYFKSVKADGTSIAWSNGADFAPEFLFEIGQPIEVHTTPERKQN